LTTLELIVGKALTVNMHHITSEARSIVFMVGRRKGNRPAEKFNADRLRVDVPTRSKLNEGKGA